MIVICISYLLNHDIKDYSAYSSILNIAQTIVCVLSIIPPLLVSCEKEAERLPLPFENATIKIDLVTTSAPMSTRDIHFFNSLKGIAITNYGFIYSTIDGGATWELKYEPQNDDQILFQILFTDEDVGYVVGGSKSPHVPPVFPGYILKTVDGGSKWSSIYESASEIVSISGDKSGNLFVVSNNSYSNGRILRSYDSGLNWHQVDSTSFYLNRITFKENTGFCSGIEGNILRSNEGGTSWKLINPIASETPVGESLGDIKFINETGFCLAYNTGKIYKTIDNGENWSQVFEDKGSISNIMPVTTDNFLLFRRKYYGENPHAVIYQTTDSGKTWTTLAFKDVSPIYCFHFYSMYEGYAIAGVDLLKIQIKN